MPQITLDHLHDHLLQILSNQEEAKKEQEKIQEQLCHLSNQNKTIIKKQNKMATKQEQLQASLDEIAQATTDIANRIQALIDAGADSVTQESLDALQADADALRNIGTPPAPEA